MKNLIKISLLCFIFAAACATAAGQSGLICGNPAQTGCVGQYDGFEPQDLIFNTGRAELGTGTRHESDEFYAVILESVKSQPGENCKFISETKRKAAQNMFPTNKVFASRQNCGGTIVLYTNTSDEFNFMAVYAGATNAEADKFLTKARRKYPTANLRKMKVVLDFSDE